MEGKKKCRMEDERNVEGEREKYNEKSARETLKDKFAMINDW